MKKRKKLSPEHRQHLSECRRARDFLVDSQMGSALVSRHSPMTDTGEMALTKYLYGGHMAARKSSTKLSTLTIHLTTAQRRRQAAAARSCGVAAERFVRNIIMGAVRSIEGERRP